MENLFLAVFKISLTTSIVILALFVLGSLINKRYAAKWKYSLWIILALRLIIPINYELPEVQFQVTIPAEVGSKKVSEMFESEFLAATAYSEPLVMDPPTSLSQTVTPLSVELNIQKKSQLSITLLQALSYLWIVGVACLLFWQLMSFFYYKRKLIKNGKTIKNPILLEKFNELSNKLGIRRSITFLTYSKADSPMVLGFLRPVLVLPKEEYSREESFYILKHELIHLRRHDVLVKFLLLLARDFHWFNPVIYLMQREAVVDMEIACDEAVVRGESFDQRKAYTETLISNLHRQRSRGLLLSTQFSGSVRILKKRFKNILTKANKKNGSILFAIIFVLTATVGTMVSYAKEESTLEILPNETFSESAAGGKTPDSNTQDKVMISDLKWEDLEDTPKLNYLTFGNMGNLGPGTLAYTVPDRETGDYKLYFFRSENEEDRYLSFSDMSLDLSEASFTFPDVREGNVSIGKFKEFYYIGTTDILNDGITEVIAIAIYEEDGKDHYDTRVYEAGENGYVVNDSLTQRLSHIYYLYGEGSYPIYNTIPLPYDSWTEDAQELGKTVTLFYTAYFNYDFETIRQCVADSYGDDIEVLDDINSLDEVEVLGIKGLDSSMQSNIGDQCELSLEFLLPDEDSLTYLSVGFIKEDTGWKIRSCILEK